MRHLVLEIYVEIPNVVELDKEICDYILENFPSINSSSQLDKTTHHVLSALGGQKTSGYDANIACRKLATVHPLLVLR